METTEMETVEDTPQGGRRLAYAAWAVAGLALGALFLYGLGAMGTVPGAASGTPGGLRQAPDFQLSLFEPFEGRGDIRLSDLRGRPVVVNFWASWCGPCRAEMPAIESIWQRYRDRGLVVVGVTIEDTEENARAFLEEVGVTYPTGLDVASEISRTYRVRSIPSTLFITESGGVAQEWMGFMSEEHLEGFTVDLLR